MGDDDRLLVAPGCSVPLSELQWRFSRSGGPGGQHANTADTRVELIFDVAASPSLRPGHRDWLVEALGPVVRVVSSEERSQARNRAIALERLQQRLAAGLRVRPPRRATRPTAAARRRRLEAKARRGEIKRLRGPVTE